MQELWTKIENAPYVERKLLSSINQWCSGIYQEIFAVTAIVKN